MRKCILKSGTAAILAVGLFGIIPSGFAASSTTQTVTFSVSAINEISVSGNPGALTVSSAAAGSGPTSASDASTTCFAAISISSTGDYSVNITAANLVSGAGSDLQSSQESASGVTTITISGAGSSSWTVKVRRGAGTWNNNVTLFVQRTSSGSGPGTITGGTSYISVGTIDTTFFTGIGNKSG